MDACKHQKADWIFSLSTSPTCTNVEKTKKTDARLMLHTQLTQQNFFSNVMACRFNSNQPHWRQLNMWQWFELIWMLLSSLNTKICVHELINIALWSPKINNDGWIADWFWQQLLKFWWICTHCCVAQHFFVEWAQLHQRKNATPKTFMATKLGELNSPKFRCYFTTLHFHKLMAKFGARYIELKR